MNFSVLFYNLPTSSAHNPMSTCYSVLWSDWIIKAMFLSYIQITVIIPFSIFSRWGCPIKSALNITIFYMYWYTILIIYTHTIPLCVLSTLFISCLACTSSKVPTFFSPFVFIRDGGTKHFVLHSKSTKIPQLYLPLIHPYVCGYYC